MIIITVNLKAPFDEGAKIATKSLVEYLKEYNDDTYVISLNSNDNLPVVDLLFSINKLLISGIFYRTIKEQTSKKILYIPSASNSIFSIIRSKLLNLFANKDIYLFALQPRKYNLAFQFFLKTIHPKQIITLSKKTAQQFNELKIPSVSLPLGVDDAQYFEFYLSQKKLVRENYNIDQEKTVLLHVGHIQRSRNLDWLINVKRQHPEFEIVIVGSTYNIDDKSFYDALIKERIRVIREYTPNMVDIYNLANFYIFPVLRQDGAIETPLSVLEAMACNLPVITTRFGSLPDTFKEDDDFHYVESSDEIAQLISARTKENCNNREKISIFTWKQIAQKLVEVVEDQ